MNQNEVHQGEILARLESLHQDVERLDKNIGRVFERLDFLAAQGHEVRLQVVEKRLDGLWGKVMGLVAAVSGGITLVWNLMKGGAR